VCQAGLPTDETPHGTFEHLSYTTPSLGTKTPTNPCRPTPTNASNSIHWKTKQPQTATPMFGLPPPPHHPHPPTHATNENCPDGHREEIHTPTEIEHHEQVMDSERRPSTVPESIQKQQEHKEVDHGGNKPNLRRRQTSTMDEGLRGEKEKDNTTAAAVVVVAVVAVAAVPNATVAAATVTEGTKTKETGWTENNNNGI